VSRRFLVWAAFGLTTVACSGALVTGATAGSDALIKRWRISIQGTQTFSWEATRRYDTAGGVSCAIHHRGDQTIRFGTRGAVPIEVLRGASGPYVIALVGGRRRTVVPIAGSERRVHRVLNMENADACVADAVARRSTRDCAASTPLVSTGVFVKPSYRLHEVQIYTPVDLGFLRRVPSCDVREFVLRDIFLYPLFTYGRYRPLRGGSLLSERTRRLTASQNETFCLELDYPDGNTSSCAKPHAGTLKIVWTMTLTRR
jgi:hypothetical protein